MFEIKLSQEGAQYVGFQESKYFCWMISNFHVYIRWSNLWNIQEFHPVFFVVNVQCWGNFSWWSIFLRFWCLERNQKKWVWKVVSETQEFRDPGVSKLQMEKIRRMMHACYFWQGFWGFIFGNCDYDYGQYQPYNSLKRCRLHGWRTESLVSAPKTPDEFWTYADWSCSVED